MPPTQRVDIDKLTHVELVRYMFGKEFLVELPNAFAYSDEEMKSMMVSVDLDVELYESPTLLASQRASSSKGWGERSDTMTRTIPALAAAHARGCRSIRFLNPDDALMVFKIIEKHLQLKSKELRHLLQTPKDELLMQLAKLEKLAKFLHPQVVYSLNQKEMLARQKGQPTESFIPPMQPTFGFINKSRWSSSKGQQTPQEAITTTSEVARTPDYQSHMEDVVAQHKGDTFKNRTRRW